LATTSRLRVLYLSRLSNPAAERVIYRAIQGQRVSRILELGIADGSRAARMIEVAAYCREPKDIQYFGLDLFEARSSSDGPGVTLKLAHRRLSATGARVKLIPGDPFSGLSRCANLLGQLDLIVVSARLEPRSLAKAWFYLPGLMHRQTRVFQEVMRPGGVRAICPLGRDEIESRAVASVCGRRRAA